MTAQVHAPDQARPDRRPAKPSPAPTGDLSRVRPALSMLQRSLGNAATNRLLQAKLTVSRPDDPFEQEADRVADAVMRMPEPSPGVGHSPGAEVQRRCPACEQEIERQALNDGQEPIQAKLHVQPMPLQRQPRLEDEEQRLQPKPITVGDMIARQPIPEEEEPVHRRILARQPILAEDETPGHRAIARQAIPEEEEPVQRRLVARQAILEEEEPLQRRSHEAGEAGEVSTQVEDAIGRLAGRGAPLPEPVRAFMEPRFGADFSAVRVHTDDAAQGLARAVSAEAFTVGTDLVFGLGRYAPDTPAGRHLLAHELTHVLQQRPVPMLSRFSTEDCWGSDELAHVVQGPAQGATLQRRPGPRRRSAFDLYTSNVGTRIVAGLQSNEATRPPLRAGEPRITIVDPDTVLEILASSPLFLEDAGEVERLYFIDRARTPELTFRFHLRPDLGSEFERTVSRVTVEITTLNEVVGGIVHEIVHARHRGRVAAAPTSRYGEVTRVEQAGVLEEAQTRMREMQVMAEIADGEPWRTATGGAAVERAPRRATDLLGEVRASFRSGLPRLTYQEGFIIDEMKRQSGAGIATAGGERALADMRSLGYYLAVPTLSVRAENLGSFRVDEATIRRHEAAGVAAPVSPPTLSEAIACVRVFRSNAEWRSAYRRTGRLPATARVEPGCRALIEGWHDFIWRNEPHDVDERRDFFMSILSEMNVRYRQALASRDASRLFLDWYNTVPEADRARAREYFEWLLIEQAISREWQLLGEPDPAAERRREMRRQHLDFLATRIGRPLRGISREGL